MSPHHHRPKLLAALLPFSWLALVAGCTRSQPIVDPALYADTDNPVMTDDVSSGWPVVLVAQAGPIEIYQPQPESMTGNTVKARAAFSLTRTGSNAPVFGAVWFTAHFVADRDSRMVSLQDLEATNVRLPGATADEQSQFAADITARLGAAQITFPLDQFMASLDTVHAEKNEKTAIQTTPPKIIFSTEPATLISINGAPKLQPVDGATGIFRVANTPFIILFDGGSKHYYIKAGPRWVTAPDLPGPWTDVAAASVPPAIVAEGTTLSTSIPQPAATAGTPAPAAPTAPAAPQGVELSPAAANAKVIVATEPTELIVTTGNPQFTPLPGGAGGQLLYADNTQSDLFLDQTSHLYYVLLSGRWFSAASLQGPWTYVESDKLPADFAQIPADSPKGDVLTFVGGTTEARSAILDASIPQTAAISRTAGADLAVAYDGDPQFKDVPECPGVAYAVNTPEEVLRVNGHYYCCHQAVWYDSAAPTGPWVVSASVPPVIYTLPPSCPDYNVRYVYIYDYQPDYVTDGYLPGYNGTYVYGPSIVYGTGYDYDGWYGSTYFPPPFTYGFDAYYDPYACLWGFDYGLYYGDGVGWFCHPWHDRFFHDHPGEYFGWHRWWGPSGFTHSREIRSELVNARRAGGVYRGDRTGVLSARMPDYAARDHAGWQNLYARGGNVARNLPAEKLHAYTAARAAEGHRDNVFAASNGDVYRRSTAGWEQNHGAEWSHVDRAPEAAPEYRAAPERQEARQSFARPEAGLEQHYAARSIGQSRAATVSHFGGGGGGFHGGGGGFHGGGGGGGHGGGGRR
jgi:hypothetical protein